MYCVSHITDVHDNFVKYCDSSNDVCWYTVEGAVLIADCIDTQITAFQDINRNIEFNETTSIVDRSIRPEYRSYDYFGVEVQLETINKEEQSYNNSFFCYDECNMDMEQEHMISMYGEC